MKEKIDKRTVYSLPEAEISHWETNIPCREKYEFQKAVVTHMIEGTKHIFYGDEALVFSNNCILLPPVHEEMVVDIYHASFDAPVECITLDIDDQFVKDVYFELCDRYGMEWHHFGLNGSIENMHYFSFENELCHSFKSLYLHRIALKKESSRQEYLVNIRLKELIYRLLGTKARNGILKSFKTNGKGWLHHVLNYLKEHYPEDIKMEKLAYMAGKSPSAFFKAFKENMQCTPNQYLILERIKQSKKKLVLSDDLVQSIGFSCGFNSMEHFSRKFRSVVGKSPQQYRREHQPA